MKIKTRVVEDGILDINTLDGAIPDLLALGAMLATARKDENGLPVAQTDNEGMESLTSKLNETVHTLAMDIAAIGTLLGMVDGDEITREMSVIGWLIHDLGRTIDILENNRACFSPAG